MQTNEKRVKWGTNNGLLWKARLQEKRLKFQNSYKQLVVQLIKNEMASKLIFNPTVREQTKQKKKKAHRENLRAN